MQHALELEAHARCSALDARGPRNAARTRWPRPPLAAARTRCPRPPRHAALTRARGPPALRRSSMHAAPAMQHAIELEARARCGGLDARGPRAMQHALDARCTRR